VAEDSKVSNYKHTLDRVGEYVKTHVLDEIIKHEKFSSHSPKTRMAQGTTIEKYNQQGQNNLRVLIVDFLVS
jgi:hypothetical protein